MTLTSKSLAKLVILLSVAIATTSGYYANNLKRSVAAKRAAIVKTEGELRALKQPLADAETLLTTTGAAPSLETTVSGLLVSVMSQRVEHGITVASMTAAKDSAGNEPAPIANLSDKAGSSELKSARFNLQGYYTSYEGFMAYLDVLRTMPVAVVQLRVEGNSFQVGLRAYGT